MEPWRRLDTAGVGRGARAPDHVLRFDALGRSHAGASSVRQPRSALLTAAREEWNGLGPRRLARSLRASPEDWRSRGAARAIPDHVSLSEKEQSGVAGASDAVLDALAEANRVYEDRFGYIFIVCATGKDAEEMLGALRHRLTNSPDEELRIATAEQAKITALRLDAL